MKWLLGTLFVMLFAAGGGYYYYQYHYPPNVLKRAAQTSLKHFSDAVASKDRSKIRDALQQLLTDDAKIQLDVTFVALLPTNNDRPWSQLFDKPSFIQFLDNVLYPLEDYSYEATIEQLLLNPTRDAAEITFRSREWADGANYYGGAAVHMRFSSLDTSCTGTVLFENNQARLNDVTCKVPLRSIPKPGESQQLNNMDELKNRLLEKPL